MFEPQHLAWSGVKASFFFYFYYINDNSWRGNVDCWLQKMTVRCWMYLYEATTLTYIHVHPIKIRYKSHLSLLFWVKLGKKQQQQKNPKNWFMFCRENEQTLLFSLRSFQPVTCLFYSLFIKLFVVVMIITGLNANEFLIKTRRWRRAGKTFSSQRGLILLLCLHSNWNSNMSPCCRSSFKTPLLRLKKQKKGPKCWAGSDLMEASLNASL